eukprot:1157472-Pelagomonas_calceolata.AAC.9
MSNAAPSNAPMLNAAPSNAPMTSAPLDKGTHGKHNRVIKPHAGYTLTSNDVMRWVHGHGYARCGCVPCMPAE